MSSEEVRKLFFNFFSDRGHKIIQSSSLIPFGDKSVLLTTAGMQQFKKYFTAEKDARVDFGGQRTASIQKCFRTTDINEIGDTTHLTFFEMLGNFSFGPVGSDDPADFGPAGYFKRSAIIWAREFLEKELGLNFDSVTVFKGEADIPFDEASARVWDEIGYGDKIKKRGREDNFWGPTGEEGPCGPTTEIYINDLEVWNLVFNQYYQDSDGKLKKLDLVGIDTGMGFERLMKVIQKTETIFETDLFEPTRTRLLEIKSDLVQSDLRIILDHVRAAVFLAGAGVQPSNLERGYVLRRILRRLALRLRLNQIELVQLELVIKSVREKFGQIYPELQNYDKILKVIKAELGTFEQTLGQALRRFERNITGVETAEELAGKLFQLYATYGLPLELAKELAQIKKMEISPKVEDIFNERFKEHQKISKAV
ncbi:MAG: alanine--tRNA ligase-related protein [Patescibacteria group bacterium]|nr:alanine--tRNA ligase-related protein [Patescibacteria group bacterium]MCL5258026.1 alanine--tRNA ligase-related protein [Patescibacteria group bacterium]